MSAAELARLIPPMTGHPAPRDPGIGRLCRCGHPESGHHRFRRSCLFENCPCSVFDRLPPAPRGTRCTEPGCKRARARGLLLCQPHADVLIRRAFEVDESDDYAELERRHLRGDR